MLLQHCIILVMLYSRLLEHIQASAPQLNNLNYGISAAASTGFAYDNKDMVENEDWQPLSQNNKWLVLQTTAATKQKYKAHTSANRQQQQQQKQQNAVNYLSYKLNNAHQGLNYQTTATPVATSASPSPPPPPTPTPSPSPSASAAATTMPSVNRYESNQYILTLNNLLRADILARYQLPRPLLNNEKSFLKQQPFNDNQSPSIDSNIHEHNNNDTAVVGDVKRQKSEYVKIDKDIDNDDYPEKFFVSLENVLSKLQEFCETAKQVIANDIDVDDDDQDNAGYADLNDNDLFNGSVISKLTDLIQGQYNNNMPATTSTTTTTTTTARALGKSMTTSLATIGTARKKVKKIKKKFKKLLLPLLIAYKLKFLTLIPVLIGGLTLLVGTTGLAGFFFALFTAVMSLKTGASSKSIIVKKI